jgi:hypothetical protein
MPKIRVVSKDSTQRHLRMVLDGITTGKMKMPLSSKSAFENGGLNYFLGNNNNNQAKVVNNEERTSGDNSLPDIKFRDKKKEMKERE